MTQETTPFFIIAVDGTAGSGKGTLSRKLATHYHLAHLDTGLIYRAVAAKVLGKGKLPSDKKACLNAAQTFTFSDTQIPHLRTEEISHAASVLAAYPLVRQALLEFQINFVESPPSLHGGVLDGRDIGTVVCPGTPFKLFLTAQLEVCAERRHKELQKQGIPSIYDEILDKMQERDTRDRSRDSAPLKPADDAYVIDTTELTIDQVLAKAIAFIDKTLENQTGFETTLVSKSGQ